MSTYLVDRVLAHERIDVLTGTSVTALRGGDHLEAITTTGPDGVEVDRPCSGLFCFIGAKPATDWLDRVARDEAGFLLTDSDLGPALGPDWALLGRTPLPFETSVPAVFAAGDVRRASMKRVAAAVGEGASAIRSVHQVLAP